ncbi:FYN-binding protein 1-like, partial [Rhinatrema bivittatum]|uniref:FYN-binding protein 1-like n=1 Tax=Rhinatrema bivittatum TaxID=194408 RepID=UPI00112E4264
MSGQQHLNIQNICTTGTSGDDIRYVPHKHKDIRHPSSRQVDTNNIKYIWNREEKVAPAMGAIEEEKENFKNLRARFHVSQQDSEGSRGCKPPSPGGQSVFSAAMKQRHGFVANQLVKKDGSVSVLPTKPQVPKRMDLAHGPLSSPAPQARVQDHLNSKIQGEVAKCETRGSTSSSDTSPCSTLQKPGARKVFPDGRSKTGTFVSDVPQRSKAAEIQQSLMEKFAQSQGTTRAAATVPAKVPSLAVPQKSASESSLNIPKRKPLPSEKVLGPRPEKPRRPPSVNLDKFRKSPVAKTERSCANGNNSDRLKQKIPALSPLHSWAHLGPKPVFPPGLPQPANSSPSEAEEDYDDVATIEPLQAANISILNDRLIQSWFYLTTSLELTSPCMQQAEYYVDVEMIPDDFPPPPVNLRGGSGSLQTAAARLLLGPAQAICENVAQMQAREMTLEPRRRRVIGSTVREATRTPCSTGRGSADDY